MSMTVCCGRRKLSGFTLIELLVVIIIITVVAGVLVPTYGRLNAHMQFDGVIAEIQDIFGYARQQAIARDTTVTVSYDPQSETFVASYTPLPPTTDLPVAVTREVNGQAMQTDANRTVQLSSNFAISSFNIGSGNTGSMQGGGSKSLRFRGDGTCEGATLTVMSHDGYSAALQVMPATGQLVRTDDTGGRLAR